MLNKKLLSIILLLAPSLIFAQQNFQFNPEKPEAGQPILFSYQPAGEIANSELPIDAVAYLSTPGKREVAQELVLIKEGRKYKGTIQTDTSQHFIYLVFSSGDKIDNNLNEGYWIQLYQNGKIKKGANLAVAIFYNFNSVGVARNYEKALKYFEQELGAYPERKRELLASHLIYQGYVKKEEKPVLFQNAIEEFIKEGLKSEADYATLETLYNMASLPEQAKWIASLKKQKYPDGNWTVLETQRKFFMEQDPLKKQELFTEMFKNAETDEKWKELKTDPNRFKSAIAYAYLSKNNWEELKKSVESYDLNKNIKANIFNTAASKIAQKSDDDFHKYARQFAEFAAEHAKNEWLKPTSEKPVNITRKHWDKERANIYANYANTFASILYKLGEYKKGLNWANDAAHILNHGHNPGYNNTWSLLAAKALPPKKYKKQLELFVKEAKATDSIYAILKQVYIKDKKVEKGFDEYIVALQREHHNSLLTELRKSMVSEDAPVFAVLDLKGNKVDLATLKGKVVILDFWATWCGPCIGSFPAMQKIVNKYKDSADVKFFFVDVYERVEDKKKKVSDFITSSKYQFDILMDEENKVAEKYKVQSIPYKFVIDKNGIIRFKAIGFDGGDDGLIRELSAMIELAKSPSEKELN